MAKKDCNLEELFQNQANANSRVNYNSNISYSSTAIPRHAQKIEEKRKNIESKEEKREKLVSRLSLGYRIFITLVLLALIAFTVLGFIKLF